MRLVLHYTPSSPFCKFAFMTAIYKRLPVDLYISNPALIENQRLESISPIRRVPVLEIYEESEKLIVLNDSILICQYLDELSNHKIILGGYEFLALCYNIRGIAERALGLFYETRREILLQSLENIDKLKSILDLALNQVEKELEMYPIQEVNIVSILLATLLGYLDFRLGDILNWRDNRPKLAMWFVNFQTQDVFQQTRSFEMAELELGAIYSYDSELDVDMSLSPLAAFLTRAKMVESSLTASQRLQQPTLRLPIYEGLS